MEKKKLLKYLEAVIELEKSIIADQQIISNMQMRIGILAIPHSYSEPQKPEKPAHIALGQLRETHNTAASTKKALTYCLCLIPAVAALLVFVYRFIPGVSGLGILAEVLVGLFGGIMFLSVIGGFGLVGIGGLLKLLPAVISDIKHNDKNRKEVEKFNSEAIATNQKENDKADEEYRQKFTQYKERYAVYANNVNQDAQRVKDEE